LLVAIAVVLCVPVAAAAEEGVVYSPPSETEEALRERGLPHPQTFAEAWQVSALAPRRNDRLGLDAEPLVRSFFNVFNGLGIPLRPHRDPRGLRALGIAASFSLGADYPGVSFHLADRCPEPLNAFYRGGRGLSWAFIWPVEYLTFRLEGGSRSEFGSYAIAGAQWNHPRLPLAIGVGVPVHMKHADGLIGAIVQIRAKLN
jgi:hypothetical protein